MIAAILRAATGARLLIALAALLIGGYALFQASPYAAVRAAAAAPLPEELPRDGAAFTEFLTEIGPDARSAYHSFQFWDVLNTLLNGIAGCLLIAWILNRTGQEAGPFRSAVLVPVAVVVFDLLENAMILGALGAYPEGPGPAGGVAWASRAKLAAFLLMMAVAIALAVTGVLRRIRDRRRA